MSQVGAVDTVGEGRVVVGYDGSDPAKGALEWAARVAQRLGSGLAVVCAQEMFAGAPHEVGWAGGVQEMLTDASEQLLVEAKARAEQIAPGIDVATLNTWGSPAAILVEASQQARLVVLGSRGVSGWGQVLLGSVSNAVAAHAASPVVVVRAGASADARGPVVLGVDGSPESRAAARAALRFADAFDLPVRAVYAWTVAFHGGVVPTEPGSEAWKAFEAETQQIMDDALAGAQQEFPDVEVERVVRQGTPSRVLSEQSEDASLVVVGTRGRGGFRGLLLGSTSRNLLVHSVVPVLVVRSRD